MYSSSVCPPFSDKEGAEQEIKFSWLIFMSCAPLPRKKELICAHDGTEFARVTNRLILLIYRRFEKVLKKGPSTIICLVTMQKRVENIQNPISLNPQKGKNICAFYGEETKKMKEEGERRNKNKVGQESESIFFPVDTPMNKEDFDGKLLFLCCLKTKRQKAFTRVFDR